MKLSWELIPEFRGFCKNVGKGQKGRGSQFGKLCEEFEEKLSNLDMLPIPGYPFDAKCLTVRTQDLTTARGGRGWVEVDMSLSTLGDRSFYMAAPKLWNDLPLFIRNISSVNAFKKALKTHLFQKAFPS